MKHLLRFVGSLAWPITILIIAYHIRRSFISGELDGILKRSAPLKDVGAPISFEALLGEAEARTRLLSGDAEVTTSTHDDISSKTDVSEVLSKLAERSPRTAVVESWHLVEKAVIETALAAAVVEPQRRSIQEVMLDLNRRQVITDDFLAALNNLRDICNQSVHLRDSDVNASDSERYVDLATNVVEQLRRTGTQSLGNTPLDS